MNNDKTESIKTERLLLRKLKESDWRTIAYLRSDKEVNKFIKRTSAVSKKEALEFIERINKGVHNQSWYYWAITENNKDKMIGSICLWNFSKDKKTAEVGYDLSPEFQGRGIMSESLQNVKKLGFNQLNLENIEAFTHRLNKNSKKLLENNGFIIVLDKKDIDNEDNIVYQIKK